MRRFWSRSAVVAAALGIALAAGPAGAVTRVMSFFGEIVSLSDDAGVLGFDGSESRRFQASFVFDLPTAGGRVTSPAGDIVFGGAQVFKPAVVSATLTYSGGSHVFAGGSFGSVGIGGGAAGAELRGLTAQNFLEELTLNINVDPDDPPLPNLGIDYVGNAPLVDTGSGFSARNAAGDRAVGVLFVDRVTLFDGVAATAPVPEPGTWALMILGFGAAGAMVRRRRLSAAQRV